ncbi:GxxExxY protein [bacterium]|nr:GxxExxY protein [bacterium]
MSTPLTEDELSHTIIGVALEIHRELGPGLLESVYEAILFAELQKNGLKVERQKSFPLKYKDTYLEEAFRVDLLVEKKLVIEIKSLESLNNAHKKQVLTYLRCLNLRLGLLKMRNQQVPK